jgi:alpha-mannosidase
MTERAAKDLTDWRCEGLPMTLAMPWPVRNGHEGPDSPVRMEHGALSVPESWPLPEVRLELDLGGEGLLHVRYADGIEERFGLDPWHRQFQLRRRHLSLLLAEMVPRRPYGVPVHEPRLRTARLVWIEPLLVRLRRRLTQAVDAAAALGPEDDCALELVSAAERALGCFRAPSATALYLARLASHPQLASLWKPPEPGPPVQPLSDESRISLASAQTALEEDLRRLRADFPRRGHLALAGHAHLDLAWLWPLDEGVRKARRTFNTALELIRQYPELSFAQSSAELYQLVREEDAPLFRRIASTAAGGRWEPVGGMWVEPDMNMLSGESIVRQLLYGQRYFESELGGRHQVAWLPDCFGFSPALPQLLAGAGIGSMFTCKLNWSERNRFPYDLFWWEGLDGSRVLVHGFDNSEGDAGPGLGDYSGDPAPGTLLRVWRNFRGRVVHPESLFTIGYGDGGGGPNTEMLEQVREQRDLPALPTASFTRIDRFFDRLRRSAERRGAPTWAGELYLERHRGTLTTQGRTKWLHRRCERDLVAAEVAGSLWRLTAGSVAPAPAEMEWAWRLLLRNQFHDILPGTAIHEVHARSEEELREALDIARSTTQAALGRLAMAAPPGERPALVVCNPDLSARPLRLILPEPFAAAQRVEDGWALSDHEPVLGLEVSVRLGRGFQGPGVRAGSHSLENTMVRVELAEDGMLASVFDKRLGREVLAGPANQLWAYSDRPRQWDAWDIEESYADQGEQLGPPSSIAAVEDGPHRAALELERRFRSSRITQMIRLWANSPRIEFATRLDWHERRVLLRARFPLAIRSPSASFETAFGVIERPTDSNTSWERARFEVAGHRFVDLSEPGYGAALLNDGRYGHQAIGNVLSLSLLRSPVFPDPLADEGSHELTYALLPHAGRWLDGGVLMEAEDLNRPLLGRRWEAGGEARVRPLEVGGLPVGLGALKVMEDGGGLALRLYEPEGSRGRVQITPPPAWQLASGLNLLEDTQGEPDLDFRPFQVRTYRLQPR